METQNTKLTKSDILSLKTLSKIIKLQLLFSSNIEDSITHNYFNINMVYDLNSMNKNRHRLFICKLAKSCIIENRKDILIKLATNEKLKLNNIKLCVDGAECLNTYDNILVKSCFKCQDIMGMLHCLLELGYLNGILFLSVAAMYGNIEVTEFLLQYIPFSNDISIANNPINIAAQYCQLEWIKYFYGKKLIELNEYTLVYACKYDKKVMKDF